MSRLGGTLSRKRVAVITAASSGIGAACARELAGRGYQVALLSRSDEVKRLADELLGIAVQGSVTEEADVEHLVGSTVDAFGAIDAAVVNTGHARWSSDPSPRAIPVAQASHLLDIPDGDWHQAFELYFLHAVRMARHVTPILQRSGGGAIVNVSAFAAQQPDWSIPSSSTIRRALSGFMKLYADRYGADGIRMNNILPGYLGNWEWSDDLLSGIPLGRAGTLLEVAQTVGFLLSDEAAYITGQDIMVDGGLTRVT